MSNERAVFDREVRELEQRWKVSHSSRSYEGDRRLTRCFAFAAGSAICSCKEAIHGSPSRLETWHDPNRIPFKCDGQEAVGFTH
jgi:hypothetical protein